MQPEIVPEIEPDVEPTDANSTAPATGDAARPRSSEGSKNPTQSSSPSARFPPAKNDKPRPHVCGTCGRSFARLEHLKRHERSHTKEKPFECPDCSRCFARRDLLLRHQQKLHMTNNNSSSRPRSGRRESVAGPAVAGARVRKGSVAGASAAGAAALSNGAGVGIARPRANTISHVDLSSLGLMDGQHPSIGRLNALGLSGHGMGGGAIGAMPFDYRGMSTASGAHAGLNGLPKLDTHAINNIDIPDALRTAPPQATFGGFAIDQLFNQGTTINPAQLHFGGGGAASAAQANMPSLDPFAVQASVDHGLSADDFAWMRGWNGQMSFDATNENAIDESSPSRLSSGDSPPDGADAMNHANAAAAAAMHNSFAWPRQDEHSMHAVAGAPFQLDVLSSGLSNLDLPPSTLSPDILGDPTPTSANYFHQAMQQQRQQQQHQGQQQRAPFAFFDQAMQQDPTKGQPVNMFAPPLSNFSSDSPSIMSSSSIGGRSARQSSVTSASTSSITESTRQALLIGLSQSSAFGHSSRKQSQPSISSPLSPGAARGAAQGPSLPSTVDIRRYVDSFIQNAHPHLPVTHIATLSFDPLDFGAGRGSPSPMDLAQCGILAGGGCLILGMAAIGALYEYEHSASKELFEAAKKMIAIYLEERRKADISAASNGSGVDIDHQTPVWLVQAMLLTVIYGHLCGDKTAADIASHHCAALVSLARAADLVRPSPSFSMDSAVKMQGLDTEMLDTSIAPADSVSRHQSQELDLHTQWIAWKISEERKRTLFAIFILSSLLITAYNQNPTIMNSEILLDLPCDEELYAAESAQKWQERGGLAAAERGGVTFASALSTLLTANQRRARTNPGLFNGNGRLGSMGHGDTVPDTELQPSTFGCLILINALHNYIWETRSRHHGRPWTPQETESMFSHIEPALNAWQAAWKANDHHKLERPNPFGLGPLAADSIPLLDLAFVRLFVNLGRVKEMFWARDFDAMADELARGDEIAQHAGSSPPQDKDGAGKTTLKPAAGQRRPSGVRPAAQSSPRRERHLRKAAFYAADSLIIACSYNLTYADMAAHELPIQSAMCFFDCTQVLAEWACTVQERVGQYLGVIGRDQVDLTAVPAIMLLENEDIELLRKIERICDSLEQKHVQQEHLLSLDLQANGIGAMHNMTNVANCSYGSKLLRITAAMLEKATVWPITHVMSKAMQVQANHMDRRSNASTMS